MTVFFSTSLMQEQTSDEKTNLTMAKKIVIQNTLWNNKFYGSNCLANMLYNIICERSVESIDEIKFLNS